MAVDDVLAAVVGLVDTAPNAVGELDGGDVLVHDSSL
jgi:hypothetical protein